MSRKDFDTNKYLELAKTLKLDSMDDINEVLSHFLEKLILRKKFKINFRSELCQRNQKTKMN